MSLENKQSPPIFRRINYIIMIVGILFLVVGYILLSGGVLKILNISIRKFLIPAVLLLPL